MRKIRNHMARDEPILKKIADIYAKDIYAENASNPTSRFDMEENNHNEYQRADEAGISGINEEEMKAFKPWDNQTMFNYYLVRDFYATLQRKKWVMPVIKGHIF